MAVKEDVLGRALSVTEQAEGGFSPFCQRAHDLRVVTDECGVDAGDLKEISDQLWGGGLFVKQNKAQKHKKAVQEMISKHLVEEAGSGSGWRTVDSFLCTQVIKELTGLWRQKKHEREMT